MFPRMHPIGFDANTWRAAQVFTGRLAQRADVEAGLAVFAMSETLAGQAFEDPLPQPAIWFDDDQHHAVLIVQAEVHEAENAAGDVERLEVLGLLLPDGQTRISFTEDVEDVDASDPEWRALIELALAGEDADADEAD